MGELRVIDFGTVSALRSQTIWHALAASAGRGGPMTLSFMRPASPYVGIGLHGRVEEVDQAYCAREDLPILRRKVGGGPVYLDQNQLFFQVSVKRSDLPLSRSAAIERLLRPFTTAFKTAGVDASLDDRGEFCVDGAKVCGHGAGEIGQGVVVVGNLIERFDHGRAARIINTGSSWIHLQLESLMRRFVGSFSNTIDASAFIAAARTSLAASMGVDDYDGMLTTSEWGLVERFDKLLGDDHWTTSPEFLPPPSRSLRIIKIRSGVYVIYRAKSDRVFFLSSVFGRVEKLILGLNGSLDIGAEQVAGEELRSAVLRLVDEGWILDEEVGALCSAGVLVKEGVRL